MIDTKLTLIVPGKKKDVEKTQKRDKVLRIIFLVFVYTFLILCALIVLLPFYYMIVASFMQEAELKLGTSFWPTQGEFFENIVSNYTETLSRFDYFKYVGNTLIVGLSTTCFGLIITILTAFAFARLKFRGRDLLFTCFLATMMIPGEMMVITNFTTMSNLGLISINSNAFQSYSAMILPFLTSVFYIYLLRQNFKQIPNELYLAAKVDGKSDWSYLWKVMVPLSSPTLITIFILSLFGSWNAYVWPKLVVSNQDYWLISVALRGATLQIEERPDVFVTQNSWVMAASVLTTVPLLILFIIFRKYIMRGVGRAGIKG
ncbi:MAG: carbohydrate ABC transporter permease [Bacilli bacterium]